MQISIYYPAACVKIRLKAKLRVCAKLYTTCGDVSPSRIAGQRVFEPMTV